MIILALCAAFAASATGDTITIHIPATNQANDPCHHVGSVNPDTGMLCPVDTNGNFIAVFQDSYCPFYFNNPLPISTKVTQIDVAALMSGSISAAGLPVTAILNEFLTGDGTNWVHDVASAPQPPYTGCQFVQFSANGFNFPDGILPMMTGINSIRLNPPEMWIAWVDVTLHYDAPPSIEFELNSVPDSQRRVILHTREDDQDYFADAQKRVAATADLRGGRIEIKARMMRASTPVANAPMYFRIYDPSDPSPYYAAYSRPGDNHEGSFLSKTAGDLPMNVPFAITDNDGWAKIVLNAGAHSAGDNYQIDASALPFGPSTDCTVLKNCYRSGVITAWKRMYVETDVMFRNGAFLAAATVQPQPQQPQRVVVDDCGPFRMGQTVYFIHGPRFGVTSDGYYGEPNTIIDRPRRLGHGTHQCELTLATPLSYVYYGPDGGLAFLADGIGIIDSNPYFVPNTSLLKSEFATAYIDFVFYPMNVTYAPASSSDSLSLVPHIDEIGSTLDPPPPSVLETEHREFASKWLSQWGAPNYLHIIGADYDFTNPDRLGVTLAVDSQQYVYMYVGRMEHLVGANAASLNAELTVHETAHNWHVNPGGVFGGGINGGHCEYRNWQNNATCTEFYSPSGTVTSDVSVPSAISWCHPVCGEWYDGHVGFHFKSRLISEYTYMRWRFDPLPLNDDLNFLP